MTCVTSTWWKLKERHQPQSHPRCNPRARVKRKHNDHNPTTQYWHKKKCRCKKHQHAKQSAAAFVYRSIPSCSAPGHDFFLSLQSHSGIRPILAIHRVGSPAITVDVCWTTLRWSPLLWMGHPVDIVLLLQTSRWLQSRCAGCYWMLAIGKLQCQNLLIPDLDLDDLHARGQIWMYKFWLFHLCYPQDAFGYSGFLSKLRNLNKVQNLVFFHSSLNLVGINFKGCCILCVGKFGSNDSGPQPSWRTSMAGIPRETCHICLDSLSEISFFEKRSYTV